MKGFPWYEMGLLVHPLKKIIAAFRQSLPETSLLEITVMFQGQHPHVADIWMVLRVHQAVEEVSHPDIVDRSRLSRHYQRHVGAVEKVTHVF